MSLGHIGDMALVSLFFLISWYTEEEAISVFFHFLEESATLDHKQMTKGCTQCTAWKMSVKIFLKFLNAYYYKIYAENSTRQTDTLQK